MICEYCDKYIPDKLSECPYCGAPNPFYKKMEEKIKKAEEQIQVLNDELETRKEQIARQEEENAQETAEDITLSLICSFVTALMTSLFFTMGNDFDFLITLVMFYIGNFIGNVILFSILSGFGANKVVKLIVCAVFMILGCLFCYSVASYA